MTTVIEDERRGEHVAALSSNDERLSLDVERLYTNHQPRSLRETSTDRNDERLYTNSQPLYIFDERLYVFAEPRSSNCKRLGDRDERRRHVSGTN